MPAGSFNYKKRYGVISEPANAQGAGFQPAAPFFIAALCVIALVVAYVIGSGGLKGGIMFMAALIAMPMVYAVVAFPKFGITLLIVWAYLVMWVIRMGVVDAPLGTTVDGLEALLILGFFINQRYRPDWSIIKSPISAMVMIWVSYNLLQAINPFAESVMAWLLTVRSVAVIMLMYFIFSYHIRTIQFIKFILKVWLGLAIFGALYSNYQEFFGFLPFELRWISDPAVGDLLFVGGFWRKFSIFSDPVAFAYNMVAAALLCVGLLTGKLTKKSRIGLSILIVFFMVSMLWSGTRGAYFLFPAGMALFAVMRFNKQVMMISAVLVFFLLVLIRIPTSNPVLYRFQTAFKPSGDASFNVRTMNQQRLKPYIQTHPIGGGLGATGVWGATYSPGSYLARVPPDSGFFRVGLELGWFGLLLFCTIIFVVLRTGINNYYKIQDPTLKGICLACTLIIFALNLGNYPQEAFVQFPSNILLYLEFALINITMRLDREMRGEFDSPIVVQAVKKKVHELS